MPMHMHKHNSFNIVTVTTLLKNSKLLSVGATGDSAQIPTLSFVYEARHHFGLTHLAEAAPMAGQILLNGLTGTFLSAA